MINLFFKGGPLMWPLLFISVISLAVIFEREFFFLKNRQKKPALEEIKNMIAQGEYKRAQMAVFSAKTLRIKFIQLVFTNLKKPIKTAEKELSIAGGKLLFLSSRNIHIQELIGSISPLIGLSGTILGLLEVFREIGINQAEAQLLASGIC